MMASVQRQDHSLNFKLIRGGKTYTLKKRQFSYMTRDNDIDMQIISKLLSHTNYFVYFDHEVHQNFRAESAIQCFY